MIKGTRFGFKGGIPNSVMLRLSKNDRDAGSMYDVSTQPFSNCHSEFMPALSKAEWVQGQSPAWINSRAR